MALSPQLLGTALVVGGVGIGAPVYFLTANNKVTASPNLIAFLSEFAGDRLNKFEDFKKVSCEYSDISTGTALEKFLGVKDKKSILYSFIKCTDTNASLVENKSLLGVHWEVLLPKDVLSHIFSPIGDKGTFEMTVKSSQEGDTFTTFSNSEKLSSIRVRWVDVLDKSHFSTQTVIAASVEGGNPELRDVYLLLFSPTSSTSNLGR